jgi:hypothetical protein
MDPLSPGPVADRLSEPRFLREVCDHYSDIERVLPALTIHHTLPVVVATLAKKSSGSLLVCRMTHHCTAEEALAIVQRVKSRLIGCPPESAA